jgi:hypothetical protein
MPKGEEAGTGTPGIAADTLNLGRHIRSGCRNHSQLPLEFTLSIVCAFDRAHNGLASAGICAKVDLVIASYVLLFRVRSLAVAQGINPSPSAFRRLAANLAGTEGFLCGGKDAQANCAMA